MAFRAMECLVVPLHALLWHSVVSPVDAVESLGASTILPKHRITLGSAHKENVQGIEQGALVMQQHGPPGSQPLAHQSPHEHLASVVLALASDGFFIIQP